MDVLMTFATTRSSFADIRWQTDRVGSREAEASLAADRRWIQQVQNGDEEAARSMVQRLYPTVMRSIRCHLPRRTNEEDLAQLVFSKIFSRLSSFSGNVPLEHWVSRITI